MASLIVNPPHVGSSAFPAVSCHNGYNQIIIFSCMDFRMLFILLEKLRLDIRDMASPKGERERDRDTCKLA